MKLPEFKIIVPRPHWDEFNPWRERLTYVPIELAALVVIGCGRSCGWGMSGEFFFRTPERIIAEWRQGGDKLDAYLLPNPAHLGYYSLGVRHGPEGSDYFSPGADPRRAEDLLACVSRYGVQQ